MASKQSRQVEDKRMLWVGSNQLRRLQDKGMLKSNVGDPTPARGGRAKRYYGVRRDGIVALKESREAWEAMLDGLEPELGS